MAFEFYILPSRVSYKIFPELGSSQTASLFLTNTKQSPKEKNRKKKKKKNGLNILLGKEGWRSKGKGKCVREPEDGGVRPAAVSSCPGLCLQGRRGQAAGRAAPSACSAQLLREVAGHVLSFKLLRMFFGLRLGAISLQC